MSEEKNEDLAEERKFKNIFLKKQLWVWVCLVVLIILAWYIRAANVGNLKDVTTGNYTLGPDLDPFLFLRYMKYIVEHGSLMKIDSMRYVPIEFDTSGETVILPYMMAYFHKFLTIFSPVSMEYSAVMFPVFMFLLTVIAFFLFVRKIFEEKKTGNIIALIATLLLIISPSLVARTVAGIPEKESAGFFFMFLSFYLFLSAWKSQKPQNSLNFDGYQSHKTLKSEISDDYQNPERILKSEKKINSAILALLAGISTAIMGLIWGGVVYVFSVIGVAVLVAFIIGKVKEKEVMVYAIWIVGSILTLVFTSSRFSLMGLLVSHSTGLDVGVLGILIIDFLIFKTK